MPLTHGFQKEISSRFDISKTPAYVVAYSGVFVLFLALFMATLLAYDRSLVRYVDGLSQHYVFFVLEGELIRSFFSNLASGSFSIAMWTPYLGFGSDVITSMGAYIGDPFNLLSAFATEDNAEALYSVTVIARLYFAGLAFSFYARNRGGEIFSILIAAMAYVFCGYANVAFFGPYFLNPMVYFPMVLAGADYIRSGKSPWIYILFLALSFLSYFYMAYMICVLVAIYCLVEYFVHERQKSVKGLVKVGAAYVGYAFVGALIAGVLLVPVVMVMFGAGRLGISRPLDAIYDCGYYLRLFTGVSGYAGAGADCMIGFGCLFVPCATVFYVRAKKNIDHAILFVIMAIIVAFPFFGKVMNGFGYPSNRWAWGISFVAAYIISKAIPMFVDATKRERLLVVVVSVAYAAVSLLVPSEIAAYTVKGGCVLTLAVALVAWCSPRIKTALKPILACILACGVFYNSFSYISVKHEGLATAQVPAGAASAMHTEYSATDLLKEINDNSEWRYDQINSRRCWNNSLFQHLKGVDFYISIYNNNVDEFNSGLGIADTVTNFRYASLDSRSDLEVFLGIKYYLYPTVRTDLLPSVCLSKPNVVQSNQEFVGWQAASPFIFSEDFSVAEVSTPLPIAFVVDQTLSEETYGSLSSIQKQQALLQTAVIEGANDSDLIFEDEELDWDVAMTSGNVSITDGSIDVEEPDSTITLRFDSPKDCELYFVMNNLDYEYGSDWVSLRTDSALFAHKRYTISVASGSVNKEIEGLTSSHALYGDKHDWSINLGYSDSPRNEITLSFPSVGHYSFDSIHVVAESQGHIKRFVNDILDCSRLTSFIMNGNDMSGEIDAAKDGYLLVSVPYSKGWTAYLDGQRVEPVKTDIAFMSLPIEAGIHEFSFTYETPGIKVGFFCTLFGLISFVLVCIRAKMHKK